MAADDRCKVWPIKKYSLPAHTVHWTAGEDAKLEDQGEAAARARQATADLFSPHVMTQVNKLRDEGVDGTGIKVAVIDSGVSNMSVDDLEIPLGQTAAEHGRVRKPNNCPMM